MKFIDVVQGSEEWLKFRAPNFNASECAAMLGIDPYMSRDELLRQKATGDVSEFMAFQLKLFSEGHAAEERFIARMEVELCTELPRLVAIDHEFLPDRCIGASLDGGYLSDSMDPIWFYEHKLWNVELVDYIKKHKTIPGNKMAQVQQCFMVFKNSEYCEFVVSDGTEDKVLQIRIHPDEEWYDRILAGWRQFDADLKNYSPVAQKVEPKPETKISFPLVRIDVQGKVLTTNAQEILQIVSAELESIPGEKDLTKLTDPDDIDQFFANAIETAKRLKNYEDDLATRKKTCIEQMADVHREFELIDALIAKVRTTRLTQEHIAKTGKQNKRDEIYKSGMDRWNAVVSLLENSLSGHKLNMVPELAVAMYGKKTHKSCVIAVNQCLVTSKIKAKKHAAMMLENIDFWANHPKFPVPDMSILVHMHSESFRGTIHQRFQDYVESHKILAIDSVQRNEASEQAISVSSSSEETSPPGLGVTFEMEMYTPGPWRSMQDAPKDQRVLLAYSARQIGEINVMTGQWVDTPDAKRGPVGWWKPDLYQDIGVNNCKKINPAAWMQLPTFRD
ncbi:MAG: hypothetical protein ACREVA_06910 [Burkholderiales bacterium]